jgi:sterol desaturase/sphingolipid hydroxylase (fatty acid hydroxylase superfamily)
VDVIRASVPFFLGLIGLELLVVRVRRRDVYRLSDSISDLSCGILSQLAGILIALGTLAAFSWVSAHASIQRILPVPQWINRAPITRAGVDAAALAAWAGVFLLDDFAYYWMHRLSHHVNVLWAGHVVHHSSEEFNLTVALRQSSLHGFMSWLFYIPLAFLGVPATMWFICHSLNLVYQFWIHTREIDRLGPLELVLNTPSHHRVHHGVNPEYQDRNFAGTLIVWDRLFGTFEPEVAPPVYGITKPLATWNPLKANLHIFGDILRNARAARSPRDKLRAFFGHPSWRPPEVGPPILPQPVTPQSFHKFEPVVPAPLKAYALVQFSVTLLGSILLLDAVPRLPASSALAGAVYVIVSLGNIGGILEARSWAGMSELIRLTVLGGAALVALSETGGAPWETGLLLAAALFCVGSLLWVLRLRPLLTNPDVRAVVVM